jgi:hypothetical protein
MQTLSIALAIAGGFCQLGGLWLVIRKIGDDRRRAAELVGRRPQYETPSRKRVRPVPLPGRWSGPGVLGTFDSPPDPRQVGAESARSITTVFNGLIKLKEKTEKDRDELAESLIAEIQGGDDYLRERFKEVLESDVNERWIGVTVLFVGIVLEVAASVLGTLS